MIENMCKIVPPHDEIRELMLKDLEEAIASRFRRKRESDVLEQLKQIAQKNPITSHTTASLERQANPVPMAPPVNGHSAKCNDKIEDGAKYDDGKTDWAILPISAMEDIIEVLKFGEKKYARGNFAAGNGISYSRIINSLLRHIYAFMRGEDRDPESGLHHIAHAGANVVFLLHYIKNKDRYTNDDRKEMIV